MIELLGYIAAVGIGLLLGLMGGGGSILTVPVMVYLMGISPVTATAYSLFVVGITSFAGGLFYMKNNMVSYFTVLIFSFPSVLAVYLTRRFLVPFIPDPVFQYEQLLLTKSSLLMILFGILMVTVFFYMIKGDISNESASPAQMKLNYPLIMAEATAVGLITGIVGIGGGFLIVPSLVILVKLPMKRAIGTSLLIIASNSLFGFLGDLSVETLDWKFLLCFSTCSLVGIVVGVLLSNYISGRRLKPAFGWMVLTLGTLIIVKELLIHFK